MSERFGYDYESEWKNWLDFLIENDHQTVQVGYQYDVITRLNIFFRVYKYIYRAWVWFCG